MTGRVSPNLLVPQTVQIGKTPAGIERSRPQDFKSGLKTKTKFLIYLHYVIINLSCKSAVIIIRFLSYTYRIFDDFSF